MAYTHHGPMAITVGARATDPQTDRPREAPRPNGHYRRRSRRELLTIKTTAPPVRGGMSGGRY